MKSRLLLIILIPLFIGCSLFKKNDSVIVEEGDVAVVEDINQIESDAEEVLTTNYQSDEETFVLVEQQPSYVGGVDAMFEFIKANLIYPAKARELSIEGVVFARFIVEKDGSLSNIKILRGIGGGCDEEAFRVIKLMPNWNPGKQKGNAVRVEFSLPIKFKLDN